MKVATMIFLVLFGWVASGIWAAGNFNAALRNGYPRLYQSSKPSKDNNLVWGLFGGPFSATITLLNDGVAANWTVSKKPLLCTEKSNIEREIWCEGNQP